MKKLIFPFLIIMLIFVAGTAAQTPLPGDEADLIITAINENRSNAPALVRDPVLDQVAELAIDYLFDNCTYQRNIELDLAVEIGYEGQMVALTSCGRNRTAELATRDFLAARTSFSNRWLGIGVAIVTAPVPKYLIILGTTPAVSQLPTAVVLLPGLSLDQQMVLDQLNATREAENLPALVWSPTLEGTAAELLTYINDDCSFSYTRRIIDRLRQAAGYAVILPLMECGFNLTVPRTANRLDNYPAVLDDQYTEVGIAMRLQETGADQFVVILGSPPSQTPTGTPTLVG